MPMSKETQCVKHPEVGFDKNLIEMFASFFIMCYDNTVDGWKMVNW